MAIIGDEKRTITALFRRTGCLMVLVVLASIATAYANDFSSNYNLKYQKVEQFVDGEKRSTTKYKRGNLYLNYTGRITRALSYKLHLRTGINKIDSTDSAGNTTSNTKKEAEPTIELFLSNPVYSFQTGYTYKSSWYDNDISGKKRETRKYFYSEFRLNPYDLPNLTFRFDTYREYDDKRSKDLRGTEYSARSYYEYKKENFKAKYNLSYSHNIDDSPGIIFQGIEKVVTDSFNGLYEINFREIVWHNSLNVYMNYKGNYSWNKRRLFTTGTLTDVVDRRTPLAGLYALGTAVQPSVDQLSSESALVDGVLDSGITSINLSTTRYHNIGIQVSSTKSVNKIVLYVNQDVRLDLNLNSPSNWKVYMSNTNLPGTTWTELPIKSVQINAYDTFNNIYVYEIDLQNSYNASYFKIINYETVTAVNNVLVTEIEVYGTDALIEDDESTDVTKSYIQEVYAGLIYRYGNKIETSFSFNVKQNDSEPDSFQSSIADVFQNIYKKSATVSGDDSRRDVNRFYNATIKWFAHRLLTAKVTAQLNENYDSEETKDFKLYNYSLRLNSSPLPTLFTTFSAIRSETYSFGEKGTENNLFLLSVNSKLFRHVNMVNDFGYSITKNVASDTESKNRFLSGSLDVRLTKKIYTYFTYSFSWQSADKDTTSKNLGLTLTYTPGRFFNLSGHFRYSEEEENKSISEGVGVNWRFLPSLYMDLSYNHSRTEPGPTTRHNVSSSATWRITKFLRLRMSFGYNMIINDEKIETYNLGLTLTGNI